MSSFLSAAVESFTPKVEVTFDDIIDEVHRLREENATLKAQVAMLSDLNVTGPGARAALDAACDGIAPVPLSSFEREHEAAIACLRAELSDVELFAERRRRSDALAREELALRCDELRLGLEQHVSQAEQAQHTALLAAQQQSAATIASLEEQLAQMAEDAARRDALADWHGAESEVAEAEERAVQAIARCEHKEAELSRLRAELAELKASHRDALVDADVRERAASARVAAAEVAAAEGDAKCRQLEGQLVRLSEGFNKQVEEVVALQRRLDDVRASTVDKAAARSWVVNYVESGASSRGDELLRMMAEWWDFSAADLQRVGLSDAPHPELEYRTPLRPSLIDAFASFVDDQSAPDEGRERFARPPPRSPARGGRSLSEGSLSEAAHAEPPIRSP